MSRYSKIRKELVDNIKQQVRFGESKHEAKKQAIREARENGERFTAIQGIYSYTTLNCYIEETERFVRWAVTRFNCKDEKSAKQYVRGGDKVQLQGRKICQAVCPQLPEGQHRASSQRVDDTHKGVCAGLRFSMSCA